MSLSVIERLRLRLRSGDRHQRERAARLKRIKVLTQQAILLDRLGGLEPPPTAPVETRLHASTGDFDARKLTIDGLTFYVPAGTASDTYRNRLTQKQSLPIETIATLAPFARGGVMLDIGANIGLMSFPRAALGLFRHIHAFEPEPRNFACLAAAAGDNRLPVTPWHTALGDHTGSALLNTGLGIARHNIGTRTGDGGSVEVPLTTLDDWLESAAVDPATITFVKIDTEGFEPKVLAGASRLLRIPNVAWQLEYAPAMMDAGGSDLGRYHEFLATRFSAVMDLRSVGGGLRPIRDLERLLAGRDQNHAYTDLLLISKGSG